MHVITFRLDIANEKFLKDQTPLLEKGLELLSEIIFSPALEDGAFLPLYVSQEKRTLNAVVEWSALKQTMREALNQFLYEKTKRKPMIIPIIMEV